MWGCVPTAGSTPVSLHTLTRSDACSLARLFPCCCCSLCPPVQILANHLPANTFSCRVLPLALGLDNSARVAVVTVPAAAQQLPRLLPFVLQTALPLLQAPQAPKSTLRLLAAAARTPAAPTHPRGRGPGGGKRVYVGGQWPAALKCPPWWCTVRLQQQARRSSRLRRKCGSGRKPGPAAPGPAAPGETVAPATAAAPLAVRMQG